MNAHPQNAPSYTYQGRCDRIANVLASRMDMTHILDRIEHLADQGEFATEILKRLQPPAVPGPRWRRR